MTATAPLVSASVLSALLQAETPSVVHRTVLDAVSSRLPADHGAVAIGGGDGLEVAATAGDSRSGTALTQSWPASNLLLRVYRTGESCLIDDLSNTRSAAVSGGSSGLATDQSARSLLGVPFGDGGVVFATATETDAFSEADRAWLDALATHATAALERFTDERAGGTETERDPSESGRDVLQRADRQREMCRYETIVETSGDAMYALDDDGQIAFVNDAFTELTGYEEADLLGEHGSLVVDETDHDRVTHLVQSLRSAPDEHETVEMDLLTADGESITCENHVVRLQSDDEFRGTAGILREVTERKEREAELQKTNRQLESILETTPAAVYVKDLDGRFQLMNETCREVLGIGNEDVTGQTNYDFVPEAVADEARATDRRVLETGEPVENEREVPTPDGTRTYLVVKSPIYDESDDLAGLCGVATDITNRVEQTRQLRETEARYEALARAFPDYAFLYDADGRYLDALLGWEKDVGRTNTTEELIGKQIDEVLAEDAADAVGGALRRAIATGTIQTTEYQIATTDGPRRYEGRATAIDEPVEGEEAVIFASRDITERYEAQRELQRQNERLDRFAGVVSHDLRNPLNVAQGRLEFARDAVDSDHLDLASDALDRMERIIEDALVLARQGQPVSEKQTVFVPEFARQCWSMVTTADCELTIADEFAVPADPDRLRRLLENLYRNSVEHGGPDVTVRVGQIDDGFYLEDDGPGIPEAEREAVFDAGYTTAKEGTGFGLSIVNEMVEAHGWTISVTDGTDDGTRFEITGVEE